eukprot:g32177.t1
MRRSRSCLVALTAPVALLWHLWMPEGSPLAFFFESKEDPVERTKRLLKETDAVFFDVDSTVVTTEGIDLIGKCFGIMKEISELTHKAMNGNRLQLMADHGMTKEKLEKCVKTEGVPKWSPGIKEVVQMLHKQGTDVYLVSGGFQNMIKPIALELHIPQKMIYAMLDMMGQGPAKAFIGYGGVSVREKVKKNADWFITSFQEVLDVLPKGTDL